MASVLSVSACARHRFSKVVLPRIELLTGLGVEGDAHLGVTVRHRSRVAKDPTQPNLRQVHLLHAELFDELHAMGHAVGPGELGENVCTRGLDLLALPSGTRLQLGSSALVEITGLRNPCVQIDRFRAGLLGAVLGRDEHGRLVRKAGVMGVVLKSGTVVPGDAIGVELPAAPHRALAPV
ncbi:MOSC domain-containing protein [Schlegelella sp. S2-27]|uniref:MOSC domain-containing protein n=1 Tax=Caldimonas mangrovi TaxID=2944811 RepID=A0ABT0YIZ6_9BURK|nr:MOSC domain-containing protein [Caldimonas mangrovi]MCM5678136.1 MOSC domain-containing protein [Caldimonas mangrovi]